MLIAHGKVSELLEFEDSSITIEFEPGVSIEAIREELKALDWVEVEDSLSLSDIRLSLRLHGRSPADLNRHLTAKDFPINLIYPKRRTLNEFFLELTQKKGK